MNKEDRFPRIGKKLISIILPTKNRPVGLLRTLDSVVNTASNLDDIEVLIRVDDNDDETWKVLRKIPEKLNRRVLVGPYLGGFGQVYRLFNELAEVSCGDWILLFNDDAWLTGPGWDKKIEELQPLQVNPGWKGDEDICLLRVENDNPILNCFPALRRKMYEVVGHVSLSPHSDSYLQEIAAAVQCEVTVPGLLVTHDHGPFCYPDTHPIHFGQTVQMHKAGCVQRIQAYMKAKEKPQ